METGDLLDQLGYTAPNCLRGRELERAPDYGHVFRRATHKNGIGLQAVYCLRPQAKNRGAELTRPLVPVTYVCRAATLDDADRIHRLVWNQSVAPFVIVLAPDCVRLYSGFECTSQPGASAPSAFLAQATLTDAADKLRKLSADSINSGEVWDEWGAKVRPDRRVEWRLLADLRKLEHQVASAGLKDRPLIHSVIGKYVYLHYLRERKILSDERLGKWGLSWSQVSGRLAQIRSFARVCSELDEWLNGSVFPLLAREIDAIGKQVLSGVASVFAGDDPGGQFHLDFAAYDFSHIPIETLSVIYEQFLHATPTESGGTVGKEKAAYYTPLPVVNFVIDRMEELHPLRPPMRVLDFSCGSGTFLVQCYRKLIEDQLRGSSETRKLRPTELRQLLVDHIFGIDVDEEACRVAQLSLSLTLLDYIEPPDLLATPRFQLPNLTKTNLVQANAFDDDHAFLAKAKRDGFDWIVGNPPWKDLKKGTTDPIHKPVLEWIATQKTDKPTGGNQTAEAFAWRSLDFSRNGALAGLLIPAMTLFKKESQGFRHRFFSSNETAFVGNFANLAEVLFARRSRVPAAAIVFRPAQEPQLPSRIPVFSPLVANQEPTRPRVAGRRPESWSIVVDEGEIRPVDVREIQRGDALTWKLAAWGSQLDEAILKRTGKLPTLAELIADVGLLVSEGLQLRPKSAGTREPLEHHPELAGRPMLVTTELARRDCFFHFPDNAIRPIEKERTYIRRGRFDLPESVGRPPHVIVSAARNWAVYEERYLIIPPRQIGIAGGKSYANVLKALALYLNSEFVRYHQFFVSPQQGVKREESTLDALRVLPVPEVLLQKDDMHPWSQLYDQLAAHDRRIPGPLDADARLKEKREFIVELNELVSAALGLRRVEAVRVSDVVHVLFGLRDGKVEERAVGAPTDSQLQRYARTLKKELDGFVGNGVETSHAIEVWNDGRQGVIQIDLRPRNGGVEVHPRSKNIPLLQQTTKIRAHLESNFAQWRYFNRNLRLFAEDRVYLFKPMQRFHWLESQAVLDAGEVIAQVLDEARTF